MFTASHSGGIIHFSGCKTGPGPAGLLWGNCLEWTEGPISSALGVKGSLVTGRKCYCSESLLWSQAAL